MIGASFASKGKAMFHLRVLCSALALTLPAFLHTQASAAPDANTDRHGDPLPEGVVARLGTIRLRAPWAHVVFSPDGKTIVTVTDGPKVKTWDAGTGQLRGLRKLPIPASDDNRFFWLSGDGRLLAIGRTLIGIWDIHSGKQLHRLGLPPTQQVYQADFSRDGKQLAVTESGGQALVRLWDMGSGEQHVLKAKARMPERLAFSPDGKFLAATDRYQVVCWDTASGTLAWQSKIGFDSSLGFLADSRTLIASPGIGARTWQAWEAATGKPAGGPKLPEGYNCAEFTAAPDGRTLVFAQNRGVLGADGRLHLWDLQTGKLLRTLPVLWPRIGPFAPDGRSFLTDDGSLQRWELATGRPLLPDTDKLGHRWEVVRVVHSPDGRRLASAAKDATIRLWNIDTGELLHTLYGHEANDLAFSPDGKRLVSDGKSELLLWDLETGKEIRRISLHNSKLGEKKQNVWRLHLTPDGQTVTVIGYDPNDSIGLGGGILSRCDLATGRRKTKPDIGPCDGFYSAFSPDGRILASRGELLDTATGKSRVKLAGGPPRHGHYAFSPDGRLLAGLLTEPRFDGMRKTTEMLGIQVWDAASGRALRRIPTDWVGQLAFSPDGRCLAAADLAGLRLWELATGQVIMKHKAHEPLRGSYGASFASCLSFAPDGRSLATGHADSTILVWNLLPPVPPAADVPRLWDDLSGQDGARAYAASWQLAKIPDQALLLLKKHLRAATSAPAKQIRALLADLDSGEFRKRNQAAARLRELGDRAAGELKQALHANPSLESRRRIEDLLKNLEKPPSGEALRELRGVAVLERIGTPEARNLLKMLAQGMPEGRITREATESLERLTNWRGSRP
jgi:WD40 repeat protein